MVTRDLKRVDQISWVQTLSFLIVPLSLLAWMGYGVATQAIFGFDQSILWYVHQWASPFLDRLAIGLSYSGGLPACMILLAVCASVVFLSNACLRAELYFLLITMLGSVVLGWSLKILLNRPRPELWPRLVQDYGSSFPSGHSLYAATLATVLILLLWKTVWRWPGVIIGLTWLLLMGVSRIYLGVHYPTDVLAGWILGIVWVSSVYLWMWAKGLFEVRDVKNESTM